MAATTNETSARARAEAKYGFYKHLAVYVGIVGMLFVINLLTSTAYVWAVWPMAGWGILLALHGATVFLGGGHDKIVDRLTERELERDKR